MCWCWRSLKCYLKIFLPFVELIVAGKCCVNWSTRLTRDKLPLSLTFNWMEKLGLRTSLINNSSNNLVRLRQLFRLRTFITCILYTASYISCDWCEFRPSSKWQTCRPILQCWRTKSNNRKVIAHLLPFKSE